LLKPITALPGTLFNFQQAVIVTVVATSNLEPALAQQLDEVLAQQK